MPLPSRARLTIDRDALAHNYAVLKAAAGDAEMVPVVKGDGYGLGAGPICRRLWAEGARAFFVARLSEGEALRVELGAGRPATLYVLDGFPNGAGPRLVAAGLTPVLTTVPQVIEAQAFAAQQGAALPVGLHVDTGMNRQGITPDEARALVQAPDSFRHLDLGLIMSHLGSATDPADPRSAAQLARFAPIRALFPQVRASLSASAGIFLGPDYRFDLVRPGVSLYGGGPLGRPDPRIRAVATLEAPILQLRQVKTGESVGYGATFVAESTMQVAILAAGYADGYPRNASPRAFAAVAGMRRRLLGRVSMDMIAVDVTETDVKVGDKVELLGPNLMVDDLAAAAGTTAYEVLTRLPLRAQRTYRGAA